ncbi:MAG: tRNA 2-thiocytidine biosynthesis protein TtcA [Lachnospiraceae bacterium]|nr:tRNA 2-thiocytidine biosynthesis protein TtcA [Lachnospiraceae bacterium]
MDIQKLYSYVRRAFTDYAMIQEGDHVAVGISGGKDSLTLLYALAGLRKFYPDHFSLQAVTVNLGYKEMNFEEVRKLCTKLNVPYTVIDTKIYDILNAHDNGKPFCSLCARLRRGALKNAMTELGCNKLAYAHHMDDVIETALLSLLYEGQFYCFPPVTKQDSFTVIRPMIYLPESMVKGFANQYQLPVVSNPCPYDNHSRRSDVKDMIANLHRTNKYYKKNIFHAVTKTEEWTKCHM